MALILTSPPALEPVTLAEAKAHVRVTGTDEDALIGALITTARTSLERRLARAFVTQSWSLWLDRWPDAHSVPIPLAPVRTITAVRIFAANNTATTLAASATFLDAVTVPARLIGSPPWSIPGRATNGIEIAFTAGHGDLASEVPSPLRHAILLLVGELFESREAITAPVLSPAVIDLVAPYREWRV